MAPVYSSVYTHHNSYYSYLAIQGVVGLGLIKITALVVVLATLITGGVLFKLFALSLFFGAAKLPYNPAPHAERPNFVSVIPSVVNAVPNIVAAANPLNALRPPAAPAPAPAPVRVTITDPQPLASFQYRAAVEPRLEIVKTVFYLMLLDNDVCRQKLLCLLENEAIQSPLLESAFQFIMNYVWTFKTNEGKKRIRDCNKVFYECGNNILNKNLFIFDNKIEHSD